MSIPADNKLFQYSVDFEPNEERSFNRKMLVSDLHDRLPKFLYVGNFIFTTQQINNDKAPVVFTTRRKSDNALMQITMREMGEVLPKDLYNMTGLEDEKRAKFLLGKAMDREQLDNMTGLSDEMSIPADYKLFQYRVDFEPDEERSFIRKMLVRDVHEQLAKYLFDGTIMFTTQQLNNDKSPVVLKTRRKSDNALIQITMKEVDVSEDLLMDHHYKHIKTLTDLSNEIKLKLSGARREARVATSTGSCGMWAVIYPPRDELETEQFIANLIKVSLTRGLVLGTPKTFKLLDDRPATYIQQLHKTMDMGPDLVMVAMPDNKGELHHAINTKCCMEKWQMEPVASIDRWAIIDPGFSDKMKFELGRAMAMVECTRQTPDKRLEQLTRFSQRRNDTNEIQQLLSDWKLQFAKEQEKFNANNPEVNWGNVIQKFRMTPSGSCGKWAVIYPPRDEGETKQFVANLVKVSPTFGLVLGCPKTFKLLDDRPATYIQQLHKTMDMGPDLVMVVMPDSKGEHYHAINTKYCVEKLVSSGKWAVIYPPRDEGPTKEEFGKDENGEKLKELGMDENGEKLKELEDEKDVVGCFSKFKAFMKLQWKKIVGCFGCLCPNTDLDKIREKGDKESLLPECTFISADGDLMKAGRPKLSK